MGSAVSDNAPAVWWVFVSVGLAVVVLAVAFGIAMVASQRRVVAIHREHARRLLAAQEEERAWVARDVHDDVLQQVMLIGGEVDQASSTETGTTKARLDAIREEIDDLGAALRSVAHRLHPSVLDRGGLVMALAELAAEVERAYGLKVSTVLPSTPLALSKARSLAVYRITQEALRNVARHAGVSEAQLWLESGVSGCMLSITDAGRGMDLSRRNGNGIGLIGMTERASLAGGRLEVRSQPGRGTVIRVRFPAEAVAG
jgi:two-component system sensor histidine kinase UhpB